MKREPKRLTPGISERTHECSRRRLLEIRQLFLRSFESCRSPDAAALNSLKADVLAHVDAALERLEHGTYGLCQGCGEAIAEARLQAVPHATLCSACERQQEQQVCTAWCFRGSKYTGDAGRRAGWTAEHR